MAIEKLTLDELGAMMGMEPLRCSHRLPKKKTRKNFEPPKGYLFPALGEKLLRRFKMPCRRWFEYHCWENEKSADAELWHHTQQLCTVLRRLPPEESDYEMYEVKFDDGFTWQVFADELLWGKKLFTRPPYKVLCT